MGTFGLSEDEPVYGCKTCFCFGRTNLCREMENYVWSQLGGMEKKELLIRYHFKLLTSKIFISLDLKNKGSIFMYYVPLYF